MQEKFEHVEYVGSSDNPYALERNVPVFICKGAKFGSLEKLAAVEEMAVGSMRC